MRILLAEDDRLLGAGIKTGLEQGGFAVDWVTDGQEADDALSDPGHDAVVLDLGLPGMDGLEVLARLRTRRHTVPVLILTARDAVPDRVAGLDRGADDYMVKPFDLAELQARLRALLRRSAGIAESVIQVGPIMLAPDTRTVTMDGAPVELSPREYAVLHYLALNAGRVLSKARIEDALYGWGAEVESNTVEVHVHHLRRKLAPQVIRTIRGVGYTMPKDQG